MHVAGDPLVLPNAWDVMSACVTVAAGARAIATTSAGVAWSLGHSDGEGLTRSRAIEATAGVVRAVARPVSADIERGFGADPAAVGETVAEFISVGVVGINLEDSLRPVQEQVARLDAARAAADDAGVALFINARIDTHRLPDVGSADWLEETIGRARAYAAAGASGCFVLGPLDSQTIRVLAEATSLPLNVAFGPGTLPVRDLAAAGASRISARSSIAEAAYSLVSTMSSRMLTAPDAAPMTTPALSYADLNRLVEVGDLARE